MTTKSICPELFLCQNQTLVFGHDDLEVKCVNVCKLLSGAKEENESSQEAQNLDLTRRFQSSESLSFDKEDGTVILSGTDGCWTRQRIKIPETIANITNCRLIKVEYCLKVILID